MLRRGSSIRCGGTDPKRPREDDPGVACGSSAADGRMPAPPAPAPDDPPSFSEYLADTQFEWDFSVALLLPVMMSLSIASSLDPWVGGRRGGAGLGWAALEAFPRGSSLLKQVNHVLQHLPWYALARPASVGDWSLVVLNGSLFGYVAALWALAACPCNSRPWRLWRRARTAFVMFTLRLPRGLLMVPSFLLAPAHLWPAHCWAHYVMGACSSPLLNTVVLGICDFMAKVPLPAASISALAQTAAIFILAYRATPSMAVADGLIDGPVPLQCGLRPEHSALLSCRPLPQQVLLGLAMVAWPVALSWAVERRLRRQHAAVCAEWEGGRRRQSHGKQQAQARMEEPPPLTPLATPPLTQQQNQLQRQRQQQQQNHGSAEQEQSYPGVVAQPPFDTGMPSAVPAPRLNLGSSLSLPLWTDILDGPGIFAGQRSISAAAAVGVGPPVRAPRTPYRALTTATVASIKVRDHPDSFDQYAGRLAAVAPQLVGRALGAAESGAAAAGGRREAPGGAPPPPGTQGATGARARAGAAAGDGAVASGAGGASAALPPGVQLRSAVFRGCVQLVAWVRGLSAGLPTTDCRATRSSVSGGFGRFGGLNTLEQQMASALAQAVASTADSQQQQQQQQGAIGGVTVQAGEEAPVRVPLPGEAAATGLSGDPLEQHQQQPAVAQLLLLLPCALPAQAAGAGVTGSSMYTLRLLQHSPAPQPARVLVLAEVGGLGDEGEQRSARLLCELAVELVGGPQEVEVALGPGELEGAVGADGVGVLQLVLVGPEHNTVGGGDAAYPLVHFVAPPLLVLPPAAAEEVCGLWEAVQLAAAQGQGGADGVTHERTPGGGGGDGTGCEQQSSLWWSHLAPLLGDLAYVLGAGPDDHDAKSVASHMLPYLYDNCMGNLVELLEARLSPASLDRMLAASSNGDPAARHATATAAAAATPDTAHVRPLGASTPSATHPSANVPSWSLLLHPFSPPAQEAAYQEWRLGCLRASAPCVVAALSTIYLTALVRLLFMLAAERLGNSSDGSSSGSGRELPASVARLLVLVALNLGSEVVAHAVLLRTGTRATRAVLRPWQRRRTTATSPTSSTCGGGTSSGSDSCDSAGATGHAAWAYCLAAAVISPALFLLCSVGIALQLLPSPGPVGDIRSVYSATIIRGVLIPAVQRLGVWQVAALAPVLGLGEVLQVRRLMPGWESWRVVAAAAGWRAAALAVSAAVEWRSRRWFARHVTGGAAEAGVGLAAGDAEKRRATVRGFMGEESDSTGERAAWVGAKQKVA